MSRREPTVIVRFSIERAPRVQVIADTSGDFNRLAFAIRANGEQHALVTFALEAEQRSYAGRRINADILAALLRDEPT